jgi:cation transporter-like permease
MPLHTAVSGLSVVLSRRRRLTHMSRRRASKTGLSQEERRQARDVAFSRWLVFGSLVLLVIVVIADALYVAFVPRRHGHLILPAIVFVAPLVTVLLVALTVWNWLVMRRRPASTAAPHETSATSR